MNQKEAYADRLEAQMRAADARLDQMDAQARARDAQAEMDEISGLRARRDQIRQQVAAAKKDVGDDWNALRQRVDANWADFRRDVADRHRRFTTWDAARERRFIANLAEAEGAMRESAARDAEVGADVRAGLAGAQQELREKAGEARQSYDAWRQRREDDRLREKLDEAEMELEEASNQYAVALENASRGGSGARL